MVFKNLALLLFATVLTLGASAQIVTTAVIYPTYDGFTAQASPGAFYVSRDTLSAKVAASGNYHRSLLYFEMPPLMPTGAVIVSAKLKLTPKNTENITATNSTQLIVEMLNSAWNESNTTTFSQPVVNSYSVTAVDTSNLVSSKREFELKRHVQAIADGRMVNYGWLLRRSNEATTANGSSYYSSNHGTQANRPQLIIQYYVPASVSAAIITHATGLTSGNGSISPTIVNGSSPTSRTYRWYNAAGTQLATTQNLTGQNPGWYGLKVYGTTSGDTLYQGFIIGAQCEEITITVPKGRAYMQDAMISDAILTNYERETNYGAYNLLSAESNYYSLLSTKYWYDRTNLMKFNIWIDPTLTINQANLTLYGSGHNATRSNESEFVKVTSPWKEYGVTYVNQPTVTATGAVTVPAVATGSANSTIDIARFFNDWKQNNTQNFGLMFRLKDYTNTLAYQRYHSTNASSSANWPLLTMKVGIPNCDLSTRGTITAATNVENTETTDLTVSITPPYWAQSPYSYQIAESPIPDPSVWYGFYKDSLLGGVLDSVNYFSGSNASTSTVFQGLPENEYFIAVFDNKGRRIFEKTHTFQLASSFVGTATNITLSGSTLTNATGSPGSASLNMFLDKTSGGEVKFTVSTVSGMQYFGLSDYSTNVTSGSHIRYGLHVKAGGLFTINNYQLSASFVPVSNGAQISIKLTGNLLEYYSGSTLIETDTIIDSLLQKVSVILMPSSTALVISKAVKKKPFIVFPWFLPGTTTLSADRTCDTPDGSYSFRFIPYNLALGQPFTYTFSPVGTILQSIPYSGTTGSVTNLSLSPGIYYINITCNGVTYPPHIAYIGMQSSWMPGFTGYISGSNSYSLKSITPLTANAESHNLLPGGTVGWVWFEPFFNQSGPFLPFLKHLNYFSFTGAYPAPVINTVTEPYYLFNPGTTSSKIKAAFHPASGVLQNYANEFDLNTQFLIRLLANNTMQLYYKKNNVILPIGNPVNRPSGDLRLHPNSKYILQNEGFKNIYATFCLPNQPLTQLSHYEAKRDMAAGYTYAVEKKLKFTFDEEYDIPANTKLNYKIYSDARVEIASYVTGSGATGGAVAIDYFFDDNRYELNLSGVTALVQGNYYFLEISTSTGEKRYVRFQFKY